jgi:hypothetical protein
LNASLGILLIWFIINKKPTHVPSGKLNAFIFKLAGRSVSFVSEFLPFNTIYPSTGQSQMVVLFPLLWPQLHFMWFNLMFVCL